MTRAQIIYADFRTKTYHKPETLEQMAIGILEQFTETEAFTDTAPCEMNPGYVAPEKDPA